MAARTWNRKERQRQSKQATKDRIWEHATGACKARPGNTNTQKTGLKSRVVLHFRLLERIRCRDPFNLEKAEAAESAREAAIRYVAKIFLVATDPVVKVKCLEFLGQQMRQLIRRTNVPLIKGRLRF